MDRDKETLIRYVFDLDTQGFPLRINIVKDMADLFRKTYGVTPFGKQWAYRFVQRRLELKTRFSQAYDI